MSSNEMSARKPKCARCRNHGRVVLLKGHKRYCDYKKCNCPQCILTVQRRIIMAKQVKLSRNQAQDINTKKITLTTDGCEEVSKSNRSSAAEDKVDTNLDKVAMDTPKIDNDKSQSNDNEYQTTQNEELDATYSLELKSCLRALMSQFELPVDCLPLLLIIVKTAHLDIQKVINQIIAAKQEVNVLGLYKDYVFIPDLNWSYHHMIRSSSGLCPSANYDLPYRPYSLSSNTTAQLVSSNVNSTSTATTATTTGPYNAQYPVCMPIPTVPFYDHTNRKPWITSLFSR